MTAAALTRAEAAKQLDATARPIALEHLHHQDPLFVVKFPCRMYRLALVALLVAKDPAASVDEMLTALAALVEAVKS